MLIQLRADVRELLLDRTEFIESLPGLFPIRPRPLEVAHAIQHPKHNGLGSRLAGRRRSAEANFGRCSCRYRLSLNFARSSKVNFTWFRLATLSAGIRSRATPEQR